MRHRDCADSFAALTVPAYADLEPYQGNATKIVDPDDWYGLARADPAPSGNISSGFPKVASISCRRCSRASKDCSAPPKPEAAMCNQITLKASVDEVAAHSGTTEKADQRQRGRCVEGRDGIRRSRGRRRARHRGDALGISAPLDQQKTGHPNKPTPVNNARDGQWFNPYGMWCEWFLQPAQRCLIPITAFAEAVGDEGRMTRTWISVANHPSRLVRAFGARGTNGETATQW